MNDPPHRERVRGCTTRELVRLLRNHVDRDDRPGAPGAEQARAAVQELDERLDDLPSGRDLASVQRDLEDIRRTNRPDPALPLARALRYAERMMGVVEGIALGDGS